MNILVITSDAEFAFNGATVLNDGEASSTIKDALDNSCVEVDSTIEVVLLSDDDAVTRIENALSKSRLDCILLDINGTEPILDTLYEYSPESVVYLFSTNTADNDDVFHTYENKLAECELYSTGWHIFREKSEDDLYEELMEFFEDMWYAFIEDEYDEEDDDEYDDEDDDEDDDEEDLGW